MNYKEQNNRNIGTRGENDAAAFLEKQGCRIIARNFRVRSGEIDIIAIDPKGDSRDYNVKESASVIFCEVKYRKSEEHGLPEQAVNKNKQRIISRVSDHFRAKNGLSEELAYRFDVLAVTETQGRGSKVRWIRNAFQYVPGR